MPESWNEGVRGTQVPPLINLDADTIRCVAGPGSGKTFGLEHFQSRCIVYAAMSEPGSSVVWGDARKTGRACVTACSSASAVLAFSERKNCFSLAQACSM